MVQVGTTKDQGLYNKPSAAVHLGALAAGTLPQYNTIIVKSKRGYSCAFASPCDFMACTGTNLCCIYSFLLQTVITVGPLYKFFRGLNSLNLCGKTS